MNRKNAREFANEYFRTKTLHFRESTSIPSLDELFEQAMLQSRNEALEEAASHFNDKTTGGVMIQSIIRQLIKGKQ